METTTHYDFLIIGAGIIGASLAAEITQRKPKARILVLEKEKQAAYHQTGRNSGVVHSGVYYTPGSLKARFCQEGMIQLKALCQQHAIPYEQRGKLLVATTEQEEARLAALEERAEKNAVTVERLNQQQLHAMEPAITGQAALFIPSTAITDYAQVTRTLLAKVENGGGTVQFNAPFTSLRRVGLAYHVQTPSGAVTAEQIISCAGLESDRVTRLLGMTPDVRIVPFRGEYFVLPAHLSRIVHRLIYPVPDPSLPFLGIHLTPATDGSITVGPNAVLALAREKYGRFSININDAYSALGYSGLWKMLAKHPSATFNELRSSLFKSVYLKAVQKYCPQIQISDLQTYRSANRAQAVLPDGTLVDDFLIKSTDGITTILNAPSPAATCCLPIAKKIANDIL